MSVKESAYRLGCRLMRAGCYKHYTRVWDVHEFMRMVGYTFRRKATSRPESRLPNELQLYRNFNSMAVVGFDKHFAVIRTGLQRLG
jgi:hypothetical protein